MTSEAPIVDRPATDDEPALRVLWVGPAPWRPDHWSLQTRYALEMFRHPDFTPKLEVAVLATHGFTGTGYTTHEGNRVYGSPYGTGREALTRALALAQSHWNPDAIVLCGEVQSLPETEPVTPTLLWAGPDHTFVPEPLLHRYRQAHIVAAPSARGAEMLTHHGVSARHITHVVPPPFFAAQSSREARTTMHIPMDDFVIGMVGRNIGTPPRKGFVEAMQAFALIHRQHQHARLLLWTQVDAPWGGVDLRAVAAELGIPVEAMYAPDERALWLDFGDHGRMQRVYSAMDVLLAPTYGESFGLPIAEALAVGVPVIAPSHTGMLDWPTAAGWPLLEGYSHRTEQGSYYVKPDSVEIGKLLDAAITTPNVELAKKWNLGQQWALNHWTTEQAAPQWQDAFNEIKQQMQVERVDDDE